MKKMINNSPQYFATSKLKPLGNIRKGMLCNTVSQDGYTDDNIFSSEKHYSDPTFLRKK